MTMRHPFATALGFIVVLALSTFFARAQTSCFPREALSIWLHAANAHNPKHLDGRAKQSATELYNSQAPITQAEFDVVTIAEMVEGGGVLLFARGDAYCAAMRVPAEHWKRVLLGIFGQEV